MKPEKLSWQFGDESEYFFSGGGIEIMTNDGYLFAVCDEKEEAEEIVRRYNAYPDQQAVIAKLAEESKKVIDWFDRISRYQGQRLGHGLKEACDNFGEASDIEMFDFAGLREALALVPEAK